MMALWPGLAAALALAGCATGGGAVRRASLPPPAQEIRAGAPERSAGPGSGIDLVHRDRAGAHAGATANSNATATPTPTPTATSSRSASPALPRRAEGEAQRQRAVDAAAALVGRRTIVVDGVDYGSDCVALVRAALARAGAPLPADARDAAALYAHAARRGALERTRRPAVADVVFLADRPGGAPAHVGIVARLDPDGTALVLHRVARGVLRLRMNLAWPDRRTDPATGRQVNDTLLVGARPAAAGSLVVGVADLLLPRG
jgi:cell wall-associated NlpC family hydrolase